MKKIVFNLFLIAIFLTLLLTNPVIAEDTKEYNDFKFILDNKFSILVQSNSKPEIAEALQYTLNSQTKIETLKEESKQFLSSLNTDTTDKNKIYGAILSKIGKEDNQTTEFIKETVLFLKKLSQTVDTFDSFSNIAEIQKNNKLVNCKLKLGYQDISFIIDLEPKRLIIKPETWEIRSFNNTLELYSLSNGKAILDGFNIENVEQGTKVYFYYDREFETSELWFSKGNIGLSTNKIVFKDINSGDFISSKQEGKWVLDSFDIFSNTKQDFTLPLDEGQLNINCSNEDTCYVYYESSGFVSGSNLMINDKFIEDFSAEFNQKGEIEKILLSPKAMYLDTKNSFSLYSPSELIIYFIDSYLFYEENAISIKENQDELIFEINAKVIINRGKPLKFDKDNNAIVLTFPEEESFGLSKKNFVFVYKTKEEKSSSSNAISGQAVQNTKTDNKITAFSIDSQGNILSSSFNEDKNSDLSQSARKILVLGEGETQRRLSNLKADFSIALNQINEKKERIRKELESKALFDILAAEKRDEVNRKYVDDFMLSKSSPDIDPPPGQEKITEQNYVSKYTTATSCWISSSKTAQKTTDKLEAQIDDIILNYEKNYRGLINDLKELMPNAKDQAALQKQINLLEDNLKISKIQLLLAAGRNEKTLQEINLLSSRVSELKPYFRGIVYAQKGNFVLANQEWSKVNTEDGRALVKEAKKSAFVSIMDGVISEYNQDYQSRNQNIQQLKGVLPEGRNEAEFLYSKLNVFEWGPKLFGDESYTNLKISTEENKMLFDSMIIDGLSVIKDLIRKGYELEEILNIAGYQLSSPQFSSVIHLETETSSFLSDSRIEFTEILGSFPIGVQKIKGIYGYSNSPEDNKKAILTFQALRTTIKECPEFVFALKKIQGTSTNQDYFNYLMAKATQAINYPGEKSKLDAYSYVSAASEIDKVKADALAKKLEIIYPGFYRNHNLFLEKYGDVAVTFTGDPLILLPAGFFVLKAGFEGLTYFKAFGLNAGYISQAISQSKVMTSTKALLTQPLTSGATSGVSGISKISAKISQLNTIYGPSKAYEAGKLVAIHKSIVGKRFVGVIQIQDQLVHVVKVPSKEVTQIGKELYGTGKDIQLTEFKKLPQDLSYLGKEGMLAVVETTSPTTAGKIVKFPVLFVTENVPAGFMSQLALPSSTMLAGSSATTASASISETIGTIASQSALSKTSKPIASAVSTHSTSTFSLKLSRGVSELKPKTINLRSNLGISLLKPQAMNRATLLRHLDKTYGHIYVMEDGTLIDGNTRLLLSQQLGIPEEQLPVVVAGYGDLGQKTVAEWKAFFEAKTKSPKPILPIDEEILRTIVDESRRTLSETQLADAVVEGPFERTASESRIMVSPNDDFERQAPGGIKSFFSSLFGIRKPTEIPLSTTFSGSATMIYAKSWNGLEQTTYEGRHLIKTGTRIAEGVFSPGLYPGSDKYYAEAIVVTWKDPILQKLYGNVIQEIYRERSLSYNDYLRVVYDETRKLVPTNLEKAEEMSITFKGSKVQLGYCVVDETGKIVGGVCRHHGLFTAAIFERLIDNGYLPGCKAVFALGMGHAWGALILPSGEVGVTDVTQKFYGFVKPNTKTYSSGDNGERSFYLKTGRQFPEGVGPYNQMVLTESERQLALNPNPEMLGLDDISQDFYIRHFPEPLPAKLQEALARRDAAVVSRINLMKGIQDSDLASAVEFAKSRTCSHDVRTCATNERVDMSFLRSAAKRALSDPKTPYFLKNSIQEYVIQLEILNDEDALFELMYIADELISSGEVEEGYSLIDSIHKEVVRLANSYQTTIPQKFELDSGLINRFPQEERFRAGIWLKENKDGLAQYQKFKKEFDDLLKLRDKIQPTEFLTGYKELVQSLTYPRYMEDMIAVAKLERDGLSKIKGIFGLTTEQGYKLIYISPEDQQVLFNDGFKDLRGRLDTSKLCPDKIKEAILNPKARLDILLDNGVDPRPLIQQIKLGALPPGVVKKVIPEAYPLESLRKIAGQINQQAAKEVPNLLRQFEAGNPSPGKGNEHIGGTKYFYLRGEEARVFMYRSGENYYVVAIADKSSHSEDRVRAILESL